MTHKTNGARTGTKRAPLRSYSCLSDPHISAPRRASSSFPTMKVLDEGCGWVAISQPSACEVVLYENDVLREITYNSTCNQNSGQHGFFRLARNFGTEFWQIRLNFRAKVLAGGPPGNDSRLLPGFWHGILPKFRLLRHTIHKCRDDTTWTNKVPVCRLFSGTRRIYRAAQSSREDTMPT
jgi:hypothetical protein